MESLSEAVGKLRSSPECPIRLPASVLLDDPPANNFPSACGWESPKDVELQVSVQSLFDAIDAAVQLTKHHFRAEADHCTAVQTISDAISALQRVQLGKQHPALLGLPLSMACSLIESSVKIGGRSDVLNDAFAVVESIAAELEPLSLLRTEKLAAVHATIDRLLQLVANAALQHLPGNRCAVVMLEFAFARGSLDTVFEAISLMSKLHEGSKVLVSHTRAVSQLSLSL